MRSAGENLKIEIEDLLVNYDDNGPEFAPVVLFIHGTPYNKSIWELQVDMLRSNYRVISYDLRGHGKTRGSTEDLSVSKLTDDLFAFIDALGLEKVILCGSSLGGYIALEAADREAGRLNALVITGAQCMEDTEEVKALRAKMRATLAGHGIEKFADELMKAVFASTSFVTRKEEVRAVRQMIVDTSPQTVEASFCALAARRDTCSNLWSLKLPVLLMAGREDALTPLNTARFMRDNISGAVLHEIEYAGHLANIENTHEFNQLLKHYIERICQKKNLSPHCKDEVKDRGRDAARTKGQLIQNHQNQ